MIPNDLLLKTISEQAEETTVVLDWNDFLKHEFLDEVLVLVERRPAQGRGPGTVLEIAGGRDYASRWDPKTIDILRHELRKLLSPFHDQADTFTIHLKIQGFPPPYDKNFVEDVEPFQLLDYFDYRLTGTISRDGTGTLRFENQVKGLGTVSDAQISILLPPGLNCGEVELDLRVFDRDPEAIQELISRGLKDPETEGDLGRRQAKALLDASTGVVIFRGDFKIRPYGDAGFDWLELDKRRVQNPSLRIGANQIIGVVKIQPEELSHLEEKSARDGLKEDIHYSILKETVKAALAELEQRRFAFRKNIGRGRKTVRVDQVVDQLVNYDDAANKIQDLLLKAGVPTQKIEAVKKVLEETKEEKAELVEQIREAIAIYQGQATLGKIIMVLLHEGRKPIGYFRDVAGAIQNWLEEMKLLPTQALAAKISTGLESIHDEARILTGLFDRLEPLSVRKRHKPKAFPIIAPIRKSFQVFGGELLRAAIECQPTVPEEIRITGWEEDFILVFTNLIENSLYWLQESPPTSPKIIIYPERTPAGHLIMYEDNGPGIAEELIRDQLIFEPGFSTKKQGTGLGLPIAGEAAERNGCKLKVHYSETGAKFALELFPGLEKSSNL